jgi:DNA-binding CsgD family transcriptional regulator
VIQRSAGRSFEDWYERAERWGMFGDADRAFEASVDLFTRAWAAGEREMSARAVDQMIRHAWAAARYPEALPLAQSYMDATAGTSASPSHFAALLNFTHMLTTLGRPSESLRMLDEAESQELPVSLDDMVRLLHQRAYIMGHLGYEETASELFSRAAEMARKRHNLHLKAQVLNNYAVHCRLLGRIDQAIALHAEAIAFVLEIGIKWRAQYYLMSQGMTSYFAGDLQHAAALLDRASADPPVNRQVAMGNANLGLLLGVTMDRGDLVERYRETHFLDAAFASQEPFRIAYSVAVFHRYFVSVGAIEEAGDLLDRALGAGVLTNPYCCQLLFLEIASHGSERVVAQAIEQNAKMSPRSHVREAADQLLHARTLALHHDEAAAHEADRAAHTLGKLNWPMHQAAAFEIAGRYREASNVYQRCGAKGEAQRARSRRRRTGRPRRVTGQLTTREWEVAKLCIDGLRNREIAQRLGVGVGTVEFHVRNILRELDLTSRYELREALPDLR